MKPVDESCGMAKKSNSQKKEKEKTWLLLRGLTRGQGHWGDFPEVLKKQFPQDQILLLDLPGNGFEFREKSPWQIKNYVEFLRSRMKQNAESPKELHVVAVSLAAMVVIEWMKIYPNEIEKAYLINTSLKGSGSFFERLRPENYGNLIKIFGVRDVREREKMVLKMTSRNLQAQEKWIDQFAQHSEECKVDYENFIRQLVAASQSSVTDTPPGSLKILVSRHDNFVNPKCSLKIAKLWGIEPSVHPWAGHDLTLDDPQWVVQQLD